MMEISLGFDKSLFEFNIPFYIEWDVIKYPHMILFGSTGSGKTYLLKLILGRIALRMSNAAFTICDFKGDDDFSFLNGCSTFFRYEECKKGLDRFLALLRDRQDGADKTVHQFLIFDEYAAYLNFLDKKQAESTKQLMATILMLGRSFNMHIIISQQRVDAVYFASARDNFSAVIGMGRLSKESVEMMFADFKDEIDRNKPLGEGNCLIGGNLTEIVVPLVQNQHRLESVIRNKCLPGRECGGPKA
jgi:DNA segregation ATPase FtsK/SpoIIIE-like protein